MNSIDYIIDTKNEILNLNLNLNVNKDYISQIIKDSFFFQNELAVYNILEQIPNNINFYIFETVEQINYNEINKNLSSLEQSVTVQPIGSYLIRYKPIRFLSFEDIFYTRSAKSPNTNININIKLVRFLITSYKFLLNSINLLVQYNIIHNNISTSSIGINANNDPILFKFKLSITPNANANANANININYLSKFFAIYDPTYFCRPLELHVLSYIISNKLTSLSASLIDKIIEDVISNNIFICKFGEKIKLVYETEGRNYLIKLINKPIEYILSEILQHKSTWDNFQLSILYLQLIINTFDLSQPFMKNIIKILLTNIHSNPNLRYSIVKTQNIVEELCYNTNCEQLKQIQLKD